MNIGKTAKATDTRINQLPPSFSGWLAFYLEQKAHGYMNWESKAVIKANWESAEANHTTTIHLDFVREQALNELINRLPNKQEKAILNNEISTIKGMAVLAKLNI